MNSQPKSSFVLKHRHLLGIEGLSAADITGLLDLGEGHVAVNVGFARAQQVQVWTVDDQNMFCHSQFLCSPVE